MASAGLARLRRRGFVDDGQPGRSHAEQPADFLDTPWTSADVGVPSAAAVFDRFITLQYDWTSTTDASDTTEAWTVFSCDYGVYDTPKAATGYSLAVRD